MVAFELLVVLAIFPLPYTLAAIRDLAYGLANHGYLHLPRYDATYGGAWIPITFAALARLSEGLPALLVVYLVIASGEGVHAVGLRRWRWRRDGVLAFGFAGFMALMQMGVFDPAIHSAGVRWIMLGVASSSSLLLPSALAAAVMAGFAEEVVVTGYLIRRLEQLGWGTQRTRWTSTAVRLSYHLYQGPYALAKIPVGWLFARYFQRSRRITALIAAHVLYDAALAIIAYHAFA